MHRWVFAGLLHDVTACTNFMVSPGASVDTSTMMSYTCDGPSFAALTHYPARKFSHPAKRNLTRSGCSQVGDSRGQVDEVGETYNVVGLTNEHAVAIGETTFGGLRELDGTGLLTYYDVMELALQRSKTAREAIKIMDEQIKKYGYSDNGEAFTIADTKEVWHMELVGKGKWDAGAVWVAQRVPDGYVGGHANQARITTFPFDDPENCLYSEDIVDFAKLAGLYPVDAPKESFSFTDVFDPVTWFGARACEARVWSFFSQVADDGFEKRYEQYVLGNNLTDRMPLFVKATTKVSVQDHFSFMRNHYENTALDNRHDVSAAGFHGQFRNSPSRWSSGNRTYVNERHVGVPVASTHFTAQLRGWLPAPIGAINWFSVDDASYSVHAPFHGCTTRVPQAYSNDIAGSHKFSFESAFWVFNMVANFAYYRHSQVAPLVVQKIQDFESRFLEAVAVEDKMALQLWKSNQSEAVEFLTAASEKRGNDLVKEWLTFYQQLFMAFRDGATPESVEPGYAQDWYDRIARETGDRYMMPDSCEEDRLLNDRKMAVVNKVSRTRVPDFSKIMV